MRKSQTRQRSRRCVVVARGPRNMFVGVVATLLAFVSLGVGSSSAATSHDAKSVVVSTSTTAKFGTILVSTTTLYTLRSSGVPCNAACQKIWPELLLPKGVRRAVAGEGVTASKLGTVARPGGGLQVTYDGQPLYRFVYDSAPGQVRGNVTDTWGTWSDVVTMKPAGATHQTTTTSPASGGVGF